MAELDSQSKTLQSIYGWFAQSKLQVNRRYQRKLVWTLPEKQELVSSVLKGYPIPAVLLAEIEDGYEIIDGLQRLFSLNSFIETAFTTADGKYFNVSQFATAKNRRDQGTFSTPEDIEELDANAVARFLDYPLAVSIMRGASEAEIDEVFSRINTYGHQLSDQERRQAGVQGEFPELVRHLATQLRGDVSNDTLPLANMPQISIDLPKMRHGYAVQADQVPWVQQKILSAGDLRDSMDEQCIADIAASIIGGVILERSRDSLDRVYRAGDAESERIDQALSIYGSAKFGEEFKYCFQEVLRATQVDPPKPLGSILGVKNPFPSAFAVIMIAFHESLIGDGTKISDVKGVRAALEGLYARLQTSRSSTQPAERRKNIDTVKGLIGDCLVDGIEEGVYSNVSVIDVDGLIRRSEIETPRYELKQGILSLTEARSINNRTIKKVIETICGIANCGPKDDGVVLIGVADKKSDSTKVQNLDGINPRHVGSRWVVGISREAKKLGETTEQYASRWKESIRNSDLSEPLKGDVLSSIDYNDYFGLGIIVLRVPRQKAASFIGNTMFIREGDETVEVSTAPSIATVVARFNR